MTAKAGAPSHIAPKLALGRTAWPAGAKSPGAAEGRPMAVSLEAEAWTAGESGHVGAVSATVQYEFSSLGKDLTASLRLMGSVRGR